MAILADYAITPDVFDLGSYSSEELCGLHLRVLREVLTTEGLVRDLRAGDWARELLSTDRPWHRRSKELLKHLVRQGRLVRFAPELAEPPGDDRGWCAEALATHERCPLSGGVIVTEAVGSAFAENPLVGRIDRLGSVPWWAARSPSVKLARDLDAYRKCLDPILRCAKSLMFIDPHLDPTRRGYLEFGDLVAGAGGRTPAPLIEIHRACFEGSGPRRRILDASDLETRFRDGIGPAVVAAGLRVEVFIWDEFHYRHVISNLAGILMDNGFDTTTNPRSITRWARLGSADRDDVQREFDPASGQHRLHHRFSIG